MYNQKENKHARLQWVDIARGIALLAMVLYHFTWDLSHFAIIAPQTATSGGWMVFARLIASSFLFLVGFSLFLSHRNGIRWKAFLKRFFIIAGAALLVSVATYFIAPQSYVYFGILHEIALTSLVGLLFLRTPVFINILVILLIAVFSVLMHSGIEVGGGFLAFFQQPAFSWTGLNLAPRPAADYVPFIPWFAMGLSGLTVARIMNHFNILSWLQGGIRPNWLNTSLKWLGQHTLITYLVHQPVLFGIVYLWVAVFPGVTRPQMENACVMSCSADNENWCRNYCGCVFDGIQNRRLLGALRSGELPLQAPVMQDIIMQCQ